MLTLVSHDLKSPINATIGFAELWLMRLAEGEAVERQELMQDLQMMLSASRDMLQMINTSLAAVRLEAGKEPIEANWENDLGVVMASIGETFRHEAASAHIDLQIDVAPDLPPVYWDVFKVRFHVINNLVSNALKFVQPGGIVRLSVRQEGSHVILSVADNGPGIPPAERDKLFHAFERLEVKSHRAFQGAGLGLYSANLFVRHHDGHIRIEEGLEGRGVAFRVVLPLQPQFQGGEARCCPYCADSAWLPAPAFA